jgi:putative effector of murein hydrolase
MPLRWLLGPALVALALVIFDNRALLRAEARPVLVAVIGGTLIGLASAWGLAVALGLPPLLRAALTTKTVTTPFSVAIMTAVGGPVALAAAFSVLTGVIGALLVPGLFRRLGIASATGRALGLGVSAHIVGTDWQMRRDARAGGLSALAFVLAGLVAALLVPPLWGWLTAA